jgi:hypothetical protein
MLHLLTDIIRYLWIEVLSSNQLDNYVTKRPFVDEALSIRLARL